MMTDKDKWKVLYDESVAQHNQMVDNIDNDNLIDEDGYPTDYCLKLIEDWHWSDNKGWFDFIKYCWYQKQWGWSEKKDTDVFSDKQVHSYHISTGGWSGNESIIGAMQSNQMMWSLNWVQSNRGGHYIFHLKEFADD